MRDVSGRGSRLTEGPFRPSPKRDGRVIEPQPGPAMCGRGSACVETAGPPDYRAGSGGDGRPVRLAAVAESPPLVDGTSSCPLDRERAVAHGWLGVADRVVPPIRLGPRSRGFRIGRQAGIGVCR